MTLWNLLLAVCVGLAPASLWAQEIRRHGALHQYSLENGLEVIVLENHAVPLATVVVAVRGGASSQTKGAEGLPHLFEHLVLGSDIDRSAGKLNGYANGATGSEVVYYELVLPSGNTTRGVELLADGIIGAKFSQVDLDAERAVVLDELERNQSDPEIALRRGVAQRLWGPDWHRRDAGGDSLSLMQVTKNQLAEAYARYYVPNNAALIVTGDVTPVEIFQAAERHFGKWKRGPDPFDTDMVDAIAPLEGTQAWTVAYPVPDISLYIAMSGPGTIGDAASTYAADALFEALNDPGSSFQEQFVGSGLFLHLRIEYTTLRGAGPITIVGKTIDAEAIDALRALLVMLNDVDLLVDVTETDLARAKKRHDVNSAVALDAAAHLAPAIAHWWGGAGMEYYSGYGSNIEAQTVDDLRRFAEDYLVKRPKVIGFLGPPATMDRIGDWLRAGGRQP